jgi:tRNA (adenine22-N1)-methyltransferase
MPRLPKRLALILPWIDETMIIADIGSDHGALPRAILEKTKAKVYASELTEASVAMLRQRLDDTGIKTYQANGLNDLPHDVNVVILTGMGGPLIRTILLNGKDVWPQLKTLILGPQSDVYALRSMLRDHPWKIAEEILIQDGKKTYTFLRVIPGHERLSELECVYGPRLLESQSNLFLNQLKKDKQTLMVKQAHNALSEVDILRLQWLSKHA